jgi:hypothetical protein
MSTGAGALFGNPMNSLNNWSSGGSGGGMPQMGGSNQWMSYPALPNFSATSNPTSTSPGGINPSTGGYAGGAGTTGSTGPAGSFFTGVPGGKNDMGGNIFTQPTYDPGFTSAFFQMLQGLMGGGNQLQGSLLDFLSGKQSNIPGADSLTQMAKTGDPISALPEWQAMLQAQQRNIGQNQANLKEQFGFAGDIQSSPFGTAMSDYMQQTSKDQNALLAGLDTQAMEAAMGRELQASEATTGMAAAETQFLEQLFSQGATASPGLFNKAKTSGLGGLLGGIGSLIGAGGAGASAGLAAAGGGAGGIASILAGLAAI